MTTRYTIETADSRLASLVPVVGPEQVEWAKRWQEYHSGGPDEAYERLCGGQRITEGGAWHGVANRVTVTSANPSGPPFAWIGDWAVKRPASGWEWIGGQWVTWAHAVTDPARGGGSQ